MAAIEVQHYQDRANDFFEGMKLLQEDVEEFRFSCAWLGIHCCISFSDAIRIGLGCKKLTADDHMLAVQDLRKRLAEKRNIAMNGIDQLETLIRLRNLVAYSDQRVSIEKVEEILKRSERFAFWAVTVINRLEKEGW